MTIRGPKPELFSFMLYPVRIFQPLKISASLAPTRVANVMGQLNYILDLSRARNVRTAVLEQLLCRSC